MIAPSPSQGTVTAVLVKPVRHEPMTSVVAAPVKARSGFIGDCHAQPLGPRQVLIVREESLRGLGVQPWQGRGKKALRGLDEGGRGRGRRLQLGGRRGSLGVFLEGGTVAVGQSVRVADARYPEVPERIFDRLAWAVERIP